MKFRLAGLMAVVAIGFGLVIGCGQPSEKESKKDSTPAVDPDVVAKVGSRTIRTEQVKAELIRRGGSHPEKLNKQQILDEMIETEMLVAKAIEAGIDKDPEVIRSINNLMIGKYRQKEMAAKVDKGSITDEEIKAYYEKNQQNYIRPAKARLAIISMKTDPGIPAETIAELQKKMEEARKKALAAPDNTGFGKLAEEYSDDPVSKTRSGDIGWVEQGRPSRWDAKVVETAFTLQNPGDISDVITTDKGIFLIKLLERQEAVTPSMDQIKEGIRNAILFEKRKEFEKTFKEELKKTTPVQVFSQVLDGIPLPEAPKPPQQPQPQPPVSIDRPVPVPPGPSMANPPIQPDAPPQVPSTSVHMPPAPPSTAPAASDVQPAGTVPPASAPK